MNRNLSSLLFATLLSPIFLPAQSFEVADDFQVTSAVKPGLVKHPIMTALDDRGRLFVSENAGLNLKKDELLEQLPNSIRLLVDTDQDGVYDKATTFADQLTFPQGALWLYDSLYVMSPPSLWKFTDGDGDGVAEIREELVTGLDFTGNAASTHGPFLHPNGRIFWCHGRKGYAVPDPDTGEITMTGKGARLWSCNPGGDDAKPFAGGGMDNPVEVDFTEEGEIVGSINLFYGRPRGDTLTHWVHGGAYPRYDQEQAIIDLPRTGDLLPEVHNFGHVAVSGMCRYRSGKLNSDWQDQWICSHFNTSKLTRTRFTREGSGFLAAETQVIFHMKAPDAHITDVMEDHNGDLLAIDTGGWFRIGCPTSHIAKPDVAGGIWRISRKGESFSAPKYPNWEKLTAEAVSTMLDADEYWLRERAGLELAGRGDPAIPELKRILRDSSSTVTARRNSVWTLAKLKFSEAADLIHEALLDPDPTVRQAACNAISVTRNWQSVAANQPAERDIELKRNKTISGALAAIVRGDEPPVARQAAVALGSMAENRAIGAILGRLGRIENDRMLEHSLIYALIEIDDPETTRSGLQSENPRIVAGVIRALEEMPSADLEALDILHHLDSANPALRGTASNIALGHPSWDAALANRFFEWEPPFTEEQRKTLTEIIPALTDTPPMQVFLTSLLKSEDKSSIQLALTALASTPQLSIEPDWEPLLATLLSSNAGLDLQDLTLEVLAKEPGKRFEAELAALAENPELPRLTRLGAARAAAKQQGALSEAAFQLLIDVLEQETDIETRNRAIAILSQSRLTGPFRIEVAKRAHLFSPVETAPLMVLFRRVVSDDEAAALSASLVKSPAFASLDLDRLRQIFRPYPDSVNPELEKKIDAVEAESAKKSERIESLLSDFENANPEAGKAIFESGKGTCIVCHRVGEIGGNVGPNLSTIGRIRSARDLFESVLYPNESIARDFNTYEVTRKNGQSSLLGLIESQTAAAVVVIDPAGQRHEVPREDVVSLIEIPTSLMPPGLEQTLHPEELRDLVAWLLSLK